MRPGLLLAVGLAFAGIAGQPAFASANLVTNGNFGTGDFTGWTRSDGSIAIDSSFPPAADAFDAVFTGGGILSQSITTTSGKAYTLSFSLLDDAGSFLDSFTVNFGAFSQTITGDTAAGSYQPETFAIPGADITGTSTTLSFQGANPSSLNWHLDDVSVVTQAIPEAPTGALLMGGAVVMLMLRLRQRGRGPSGLQPG